jgi:multidrug efflux pump subunit AcrA (membrane-fusion protein)
LNMLRRTLTCAALASLVFVAPSHLFAQAGGAAPVRVFKVEVKDIAPEQSFVGTVMPLKKAIVGSAVDGRVIDYPIKQGDYLENEGVLAQLLTETINKELATAVAERSLRQAEVDELKAGSRKEEIDQAKARMDAAKARMDYTGDRLQRLQSLTRGGRATSSEELDEAVSASEAATSAYREAVAGHELAVAGPREEHKLQAAARLDMQQAVVEKLEDQLQKHTVRTRFAGWVSAEYTQVGAWVNRGDPVAEVVALETVEVEVHVVEDHVPHVKLNAPAEIFVPSLGRSFSEDVKVAAIVPQADPRSRTFPVRVSVPNEMEQATAPAPRLADDANSGESAETTEKARFSPVLKAGMLAQVWLPTGPKQNGPTVRKDALVFTGRQTTVWLIDPKTVKDAHINGVAHKQGEAMPVQVQPTVEAREMVLIPEKTPSGHYLIPPGFYVITEGNERVRPAGPGKPALVYWPAEESSTAPPPIDDKQSRLSTSQ